jgi:hypothetical protein
MGGRFTIAHRNVKRLAPQNAGYRPPELACRDAERGLDRGRCDANLPRVDLMAPSHVELLDASKSQALARHATFTLYGSADDRVFAHPESGKVLDEGAADSSSRYRSAQKFPSTSCTTRRG